MKIIQTKYEFSVKSERSFAVIISAFRRGEADSWKWNVYAHIGESHKLYNKKECLDLHFHGGPTFSEKIIYQKIDMYNFTKGEKSKIFKIGSDYMHLHDDYGDMNPADGIPIQIQNDAAKLVEELLK